MLSILIVEDEKFIRKGLVEFHPWHQWGYARVDCASDGREGFKRILQGRPDVVITDIRMPSMDGIAMICAARRAGYENPFIIISGHADFEYAQKAIEYDVTAYLLKPIRDSELQTAVAKAASRLGGSRQAVEFGHADVDLSRVLNYISSNFTRDIRTKDLAGIMYRSESQFNRIFKAQLNMRAVEYINQLRVLRARELLEEGETMIYQVAIRSGFTDAQYFSRVFKQATGLTPSQYKEKCHANPSKA